MPNGLHLSDEDFYRATITAKQYLLSLEAYLERMLAFGAVEENVARFWFTRALITLGYKDYADYEASVEEDTRIINPPTDYKWTMTPTTMRLGGLKTPSSNTLPYFKQVVAPITYRKEADRLAIQYGHIDAEGNIVNEAAYNTLLRNATQDAEQYQYDFIQENLRYQEDVAEFTGEKEKAEKAAENLRKVEFFLAGQRQEQALRERAGLEAQRRAEAWAGEEEAARREREAEAREREGVRTKAEEEAARIRGETVQEFLGADRPAGLQEFMRGELPGVLEEFEREQEGARRAWWSTLARPERPTYEERLREAEFQARRWQEVREKGLEKDLGVTLWKRGYALGRVPTAQDMTPEEYYFTISQRKAQEYQASAEALRGYTPERIARMDRPREIPEDPLAKYLAQYPWQAEFFKLSPAQRGFRPSMYAPSARWFV